MKIFEYHVYIYYFGDILLHINNKQNQKRKVKENGKQQQQQRSRPLHRIS